MKKTVFFDDINFCDGYQVSTSPQKAQILKTLPFSSYLSCIIKDPPDHQDLILAICYRQNMIDPTKQYRFCFVPLFDGSMLVLAVEQKLLVFPSLPNILLPFGCQDKFLVNAMFCFEDCLVAFYKNRLLYFQQYANFSDILESLEKIKQKYNIEIKKIYCEDHYESLGEILESFHHFGQYPIALLCVKCFHHHPDFFVLPKPKFFKQQSFILALVFAICVLLLFVTSFLASRYVRHLESSIPPLQKEHALDDRGYFSRYLLFAKASKMAYEHHISFERVEFSSFQSDFAAVFYVCFRHSADFLDWSDEMQKILKANLILDTFKDDDKNYSCTWASWVNQK